MKGNIVVIEDDKDMCDMLEVGLSRRGMQVATYVTGEQGISAVDLHSTDVVLTDINLPDISGIDICKTLGANYPDIPVVIMTAFGNMDTAIAAIRAGAYDFITKPLDIDILTLSLQRALHVKYLQETVRKLGGKTKNIKSFEGLIGESTKMVELFSQLSRIADSTASLLITGESGSGKELAAKAVHLSSSRQKKPLITINCAAMPSQLLESELFGHKKGAFTDAITDNKGLFLEADGGTLFLDEIGELSIDLQPKLLRAIEERKVRPVGGSAEKNFDVRLIAATNQDLESAVEEGRFREDLFYRLNVIQIEMPPLRSRGTDVLVLAEEMVKEISHSQKKDVTGITESAAKRLLDYNWPGNVRELRNAVEHAVALTRFDKITPEDLPEKIRLHQSEIFSLPVHDPSELISMEELEKRYITHVLKSTNGNRTQTAKILKLDRKTLYRKLQRYEEID